MPAEVANWVGRVIDGRYVVDSVIGQGGMGVVLRARHKFTSAQVALKMLNAEFQVNAEVQDRFLAEARTPSTIGHPGIVQVLDAGATPEGELYFAMELLTGRTLRQAMYPSLPPQVARRITLELLDALGAAHARGIIHRDLKPENVFLINPTGTVKLLDFGIAKVIQTARTNRGALLGTLSYMSPEQLMDASSVDARADLWAVGVMIYEMLSGQLPYRATTLVEVIDAFNTRDADSIRRHVPPATLWLDRAEAFFARALARDRLQRFSSTQEVAAALSSIGLEDTQITTAGSTLTGVMASRRQQMTAADSGPGLPRSGSGVIAMPRGRPSAPNVVPAGSQHVSPPQRPSGSTHGTPSTPYVASGSQAAVVPVRNVRGSQAPVDDPFPPANPAFANAPASPLDSAFVKPADDADAGATIPAVPLFGGPATPQAATFQSKESFGVAPPTMPAARGAVPSGSPSQPFAAPSSGSPSQPFTVQGMGSPSQPFAVPTGSPSQPLAVPQSGTPSAPFAVPQSGTPSAPFAVPSSPSQPFAVPASPSAPVPIPQPPQFTPPTWGMPPPQPSAIHKEPSSGLGTTSWIVIGVVIVAFIGIIVLVRQMNADQGNSVSRCEERCKKSKCASTLDGATSCAVLCQFSPSKTNECLDKSGGSCDTIGTCVKGGR